ncbi:hypothetical protein DUNSADRAFT_16849 [Dunaliella salina]|uniref:LAGLIDADG homing endonuclease n=1 Tax=Dunaliella salina TaxID=3046 RepID=A0ABQ7G2S2_DUNSA|nr:hypothetical protein DUNSADRAFT_16849 [Dunaliella salina]|eukprot:KAF5828904.1 hypothetical protein DUNSADRAFT_16849 [Dunaliella salina]
MLLQQQHTFPGTSKKIAKHLCLGDVQIVNSRSSLFGIQAHDGNKEFKTFRRWIGLVLAQSPKSYDAVDAGR